MAGKARENGLVSVVIPTFNKWPYTERCLEALLRSTHRPFEVIVVDNGSTDGTPEHLPGWAAEGERRGAPFKLIRNESNRGASTARNQGIDKPAGPNVFPIQGRAR